MLAAVRVCVSLFECKYVCLLNIPIIMEIPIIIKHRLHTKAHKTFT